MTERLNSICSLILLIMLLAFFSNCSKSSCDGQIECPVIVDSLLTMTPYLEEESIVFINDNNEELVFIVDDTTRTKEWKEGCFYNSESNDCDCYTCIPKSGYTSYTQDSSRSIIDNNKKINLRKLELNVSEVFDEENNSTILIDFHVFNFKKGNVEFTPLNLEEGDELIPSLILGSETYTNVVRCYADTSAGLNDPMSPEYPYAKYVYFNQEHGLLGFYDLKTAAVFYLKP